MWSSWACIASLSRSVTGCMRSLRGPRGIAVTSAAAAGRGGSTAADGAASTTASWCCEAGSAPPAPVSAPSTKALAAGLSSASKRLLLGGRADGAGGVLMSGNLLVERGDFAASIGVDYAAQHGRLPCRQPEFLVVLKYGPLDDDCLQHCQICECGRV